MEARKCTNCGATLKRIGAGDAWFCPFCDVRYEDKTAAGRKKKNKYGLRGDFFEVEADLKDSLKKKRVAGCVSSIAYCLDNYDTSAEIEEYIRRKMSLPDDVFAQGTDDDRIREVMPAFENILDPGERVIFYVNTGILSRGRDYYVITDKRSIFVDNKDVRSVRHSDIGSLMLGDSFGAVNWFINGDYDMCLLALDSDGRFHGALIALICMMSFEQDTEGDRIRIIN